MNRLRLLLIILLGGGCATRIPYTGTLADVEHKITEMPPGHFHFVVEDRGQNWIQYKMMHDVSGIFWNYGSVRIKVSSGQMAIRGPEEGRALVERAVQPK
jgi:hypothetical protein